MTEPSGLQLCPDCGAILPLAGVHNCAPQKRINLSLNRTESNFIAWVQAYACATMTGKEALGLEAFKHVVAYANALGVSGINSLGDRHTLLAQAMWPDLKIKEINYDPEKPPTPGVSQ